MHQALADEHRAGHAARPVECGRGPASCQRAIRSDRRAILDRAVDPANVLRIDLGPLRGIRTTGVDQVGVVRFVERTVVRHEEPLELKSRIGVDAHPAQKHLDGETVRIDHIRHRSSARCHRIGSTENLHQSPVGLDPVEAADAIHLECVALIVQRSKGVAGSERRAVLLDDAVHDISEIDRVRPVEHSQHIAWRVACGLREPHVTSATDKLVVESVVAYEVELVRERGHAVGEASLAADADGRNALRHLAVGNVDTKLVDQLHLGWSRCWPLARWPRPAHRARPGACALCRRA